jgi:hypothetical protein
MDGRGPDGPRNDGDCGSSIVTGGGFIVRPFNNKARIGRGERSEPPRKAGGVFDVGGWVAPPPPNARGGFWGA